MKKFMKYVGLLIIIAVLLAGCVKNQTVYLSFDKTDAYFTSKVKLAPIGGEVPVQGDAFESASIVISSQPASRFQLVLKLNGGTQSIDGLEIMIDDTVYAFADAVVLFDSVTESESVTLSMKIFMRKDAPVSLQDTTVAFTLSLQAESESKGFGE